ncbi:hypothetical protein [Actinokineospora pegani]|uniref:hypothetical protein n=1 Tax=Actinokineospora pegani TaxID=2654637 RepID=UPI0012EA319E|nr:hypothetical protein [Actinokineospora pegani]
MTGLPERLRTTARQAGRPLWMKFRGRVEALISERITEASHDWRGRDDALRERIDEQQEQIRILSTDLATAVADADRRLHEVAASVDWLDHEHRRMSPQIAAAEARLAELERRAARPDLAAAEQADPALAALVEELRAEHAKIRARLGTVSRYEERLARLEEKTPSV